MVDMLDVRPKLVSRSLGSQNMAMSVEAPPASGPVLGPHADAALRYEPKPTDRDTVCLSIYYLR
jgi:hypothetical protein